MGLAVGGRTRQGGVAAQALDVGVHPGTGVIVGVTVHVGVCKKDACETPASLNSFHMITARVKTYLESEFRFQACVAALSRLFPKLERVFVRDTAPISRLRILTLK